MSAQHAVLSVNNLSWSAGGKVILDNISLQLQPGRFVGLLGPNGAGKSSLMRCIYRVNRPDAGDIRLLGRDLWRLSGREAAQAMAVILQEHSDHFGLSARDVVSLGLIPHKRLFEWENRRDQAQVAEVMQSLELDALAHLPFMQLSGGEKQRCMLARALVQQPRLLIMDEPTNHLDVHYQIELLRKVRALGLTVLASFHDLNLAAAFCDELVVLHEGRVAAQGPVETVMTEDMIAQIFRTCARVDRHPLHAHPRVTYAYHDEVRDD